MQTFLVVKGQILVQVQASFPGRKVIFEINFFILEGALQAGIEELNRAAPQTPEEQHRNFLLKKELVDELVEEVIIDGKRDIQVEFRAKIIDLAVSKRALGFPTDGEIVVRL